MKGAASCLPKMTGSLPKMTGSVNIPIMAIEVFAPHHAHLIYIMLLFRYTHLCFIAGQP